MDGTHIEADAALKSLRAELEPIDGHGEGEGESEGAQPRPALELAEPRSGPTPKRVASNATALSRTDPDAKLRHKPGHRKHLVHRGQVAVDPKHRVIIAVGAERATGSEADCLTGIVTRARFAGHTVAELTADTGYASQDSYDTLAKLKATALIPPQPAAKHAAAHAARERMRTPTGRDAALDRQAHAEGAIAELKRHGADRARCRGTRLVELQLLAAATAINLKRLLDHGHAAQHSQTSDPDTRHEAADGQTGAPQAPRAAQHGPIATPAVRHTATRVLTRTLIAPSTKSTASRQPIVQQTPSARRRPVPSSRGEELGDGRGHG